MHEKNNQEPSDKSPIRIILLDDEVEVCEIIGLFVSRAGYDVISFNDPLLFLEALPGMNPQPTLLITDYYMPGMNGLEVLRHAKAIVPNLKSISISGAMAGDDLSGKPYAPNALLPKPFPTSELLKLLDGLCRAEP